MGGSPHVEISSLKYEKWVVKVIMYLPNHVADCPRPRRWEKLICVHTVHYALKHPDGNYLIYKGTSIHPSIPSIYFPARSRQIPAPAPFHPFSRNILLPFTVYQVLRTAAICRQDETASTGTDSLLSCSADLIESCIK